MAPLIDMTFPRIVTFSPAAASGKIDSFQLAGAQLLASRIQAQWMLLGYAGVKVWVEDQKMLIGGSGNVFVPVIRSNLVNGVPPGRIPVGTVTR